MLWVGLVLSLLVGWARAEASAEDELRAENCFRVCVAKCLHKSKGIQSCGAKCKDYRNRDICETPKCWRRCKGLLDHDLKPSDVPLPFNLSASYNADSQVDIGWQADADAFVIQFKPHSRDEWNLSDQLILDQNTLTNFSMKDADVCEALDFRVASISAANGVGDFSDASTINPPEPRLSHLTHVSSTFKPPQEDNRSQFPNGTVEIVFSYESDSWPLGDDDLIVNVNFHNVKCVKPDFHGVENPEFYKGARPRTLVGVASADYMYRECVFSYGIQKVTSSQCKKTFNFDTTFSILYLNCSNVVNSNCVSAEKTKGPVCGQVSNFKYEVVDPESVDWSDPNANITVNITFEPMHKIKKDVLYFVALYGEAIQYDNVEKSTHMGVNLTTELGRVSNCPVLQHGNAQRRGELERCASTPANTIQIANLHVDRMYGVTMCGVRDASNLDLPRLDAPKSVKPRADLVLVEAARFRGSRTWFYVALAALALAVLVASLVAYQCRRERNWKIEKKKLELSHSAAYSDQRYTDLPKVQDVWELERRNLIIYEDKQLGSGAFGSVFLGKLIGSAKGPKEVQSTLGINLMRVENCEVAVKMLPEYADEMSKQEFLREIALMKTLGFHERLVNMLACITDSEPYCLVVEYCSDGDLHHFLKARCQYMLHLEQDAAADADPDMVMSLKQLLMFSVQISYGLEYLSQKGFVHRDVAARNVLVHDRNCAKIGDFGLCRFIYAEGAQYRSKGGRLPVKWMSPEAIRHYEFTTKSDVWSFGVLMFEVITLGGSPYPGVQPDDMLAHLEAGGRMERPDNCPDEFYDVMTACWDPKPDSRPNFSEIRRLLAKQLEAATDEYSYLKLDAGRDYYRVSYSAEDGTPKVETISVGA